MSKYKSDYLHVLTSTTLTRPESSLSFDMNTQMYMILYTGTFILIPY
jgi:hypothetical protein